MSRQRIYILTSPVHSGKTTTLQLWLRNHKFNAAGILTPDIDGKRKLYDIANDRYHDLELDENMPVEDCLPIGRYRFSKEVFKIGRDILLRSAEMSPEWLIVDEVGKLELHQKAGLEPAVTHIINKYKNENASGKLLLVIRDHLLDEAIATYGLDKSMVLNKSFFE